MGTLIEDAALDKVFLLVKSILMLASIKLHLLITEITLQHECSPVCLLHIFRTSFPKSIFRGVKVAETVSLLESEKTFKKTIKKNLTELKNKVIYC